MNKLFERHQSQAFESREQRIEDAQALHNMYKLPFYDRIERESEEYWELDILDQEVILEVSDPNF